GEARNTYNASRAGLFQQNITYSFSLQAAVDLGGKAGYVESKAWHGDPFGYTVGAVGTNLTFDQSLRTGTMFQANQLTPDRANLDLYVRVGLGTAFDPGVPATLWNNPDAAAPGPAPANAVDLLSIQIAENAAGTGVTATVNAG